MYIPNNKHIVHMYQLHTIIVHEYVACTPVFHACMNTVLGDDEVAGLAVADATSPLDTVVAGSTT